MIKVTCSVWFLTFSYFLNPSIKKKILKEKEQIEKPAETNKPP